MEERNLAGCFVMCMDGIVGHLTSFRQGSDTFLVQPIFHDDSSERASGE